MNNLRLFILPILAIALVAILLILPTKGLPADFETRLEACYKLKDLGRILECQDKTKKLALTDKQKALLETEIGTTVFIKSVYAENSKERRALWEKVKKYREKAYASDPNNTDYKEKLESIKALLKDDY